MSRSHCGTAKAYPNTTNYVIRLFSASPATADLIVTESVDVCDKVRRRDHRHGGGLTYTITAANAGPSDDPSVSLTTFPADLTGYTSVAAGGATGNTNGSGDLSETCHAGGVVGDVHGQLHHSLVDRDVVEHRDGFGVADRHHSGQRRATDSDGASVRGRSVRHQTDGVTSATLAVGRLRSWPRTPDRMIPNDSFPAAGCTTSTGRRRATASTS